MKIECTESQKKVLISIVEHEGDLCPFANTPTAGCGTSDISLCHKCFENNVNWTIIEEDEQ